MLRGAAWEAEAYWRTAQLAELPAPWVKVVGSGHGPCRCQQLKEAHRDQCAVCAESVCVCAVCAERECVQCVLRESVCVQCVLRESVCSVCSVSECAVCAV